MRAIGDLFPETKPPRRAPHVLMQVVDMGEGERGGVMAQFACSRCERETEWMHLRTMTEAKRGVPCSVCNANARAA